MTELSVSDSPLSGKANIPLGLCACGCGGKTSIASVTSTRDGTKKGKPNRYVHNHHGRRPERERFCEKVKKTDGCWIWTGAKAHWGYGHFNYAGRYILSHRVSWILEHGEIPHGLWVLHKCDTPACVRPDHLFLGTHKDNMADMAMKSRTNHGEAHWKSVLCPYSVLLIRRLKSEGAGPAAISKFLGVSRDAVKGVVRGKTWKVPHLGL